MCDLRRRKKDHSIAEFRIREGALRLPPASSHVTFTLYEVLALYTVTIDYEVCENSGFCFELCPEEVFELKVSQVIVAHPESCTGCWLCVEHCPTGAVTVE